MNQQPDKLFRDKLADLEKAPPASAWDRLNTATRPAKTAGNFWLRIAASLLLLALAGVVFVMLKKDVASNPSANTTIGNGTSRAGEASIANDAATQNGEASAAHGSDRIMEPDEIAPENFKNQETTSHHSGKENLKQEPEQHRDQTAPVKGAERNEHRYASGSAIKTDRQTDPSTAVSGAALSENDRASSEEKVAHNGIDIRDRADLHRTVTTEPSIADVAMSVEKPTKPLTLTYSVEQVSGYLVKNDEPQATPDDEKPSTLKKLLHKANDLKTNQEPFGDLRQKKNEILALNFMNEKRGQKTRN